MVAAREFLAEIASRPEDDTPRLVFADWLEEQGSPWGEFVRVQVELDHPELSPVRRLVLQRTEQALWREHGPAWLAPLRRLGIHEALFRRGCPHEIVISPTDLLRRGAQLFDEYPTIEALHSPTDRRLGALVRSPLMGRFRSLKLADLELTGELASLRGSSHAGRLERLGLRNCRLRRARLDSLASHACPRLRQLDLLGSDLDIAQLRSLARRGDAPPFHDLDLGRTRCQGDEVVRLLGELRWLRGLTSLGLSGLELTGTGINELLQSRQTAELRRLDLSRNSLRSYEARLLLRGTDALGQLEELDLHGNRLGDLGTELLSVARLPALRRLDLRDNQLDDRGAQAVAGSRLLSHLVSVDLRHNGISPDAVDLLRRRLGERVLV